MRMRLERLRVQKAVVPGGRRSRGALAAQLSRFACKQRNDGLLGGERRRQDGQQQQQQGAGQTQDAQAPSLHGGEFGVVAQHSQADDCAQQTGHRQQIQSDARQFKARDPHRIQGAERPLAHILQLLRQRHEAEQTQKEQENRGAATHQRPQQMAVQQVQGAAQRETSQAAARLAVKPAGAHQRWGRVPCSTAVRAMPMKLK